MQKITDNKAEALRSEAFEMLCEHNISEAVKKLEKARSIMPEDMQILNLIADCFYIIGDFGKAESYWRKVLENEPDNKIARAKLKNFNTPAFQFWLKRYNKALDLMEGHDYERAKEIFRLLLQENDSFISVYKFLGLCYAFTGDKDSAFKIWSQGLKMDKSNADINRYLVEFFEKEAVYLADEDPDMSSKAVNVKTFGLPLNRTKLAWAVSGLVFLVLTVQIISAVSADRSFLHEAASVNSKVVEEKASPNEQFVPALSANQSVSENYEEDTLSQGSYYDEDKEIYYYREGYKAYKTGNLNKAVSNLSAVVAINSGSYINREALYYLARTFYLKKDYENAEEYYLKYLNLFPDSNYYDESLYYLGLLYHERGDFNKAKEMFVKLKQLYPQSGYVTSDLFKKVVNGQ
ncbi:tetratricopeptide repeat protein [Thermosyntropha sp.]|uniref:tetratricopeptide repeat protein n=1 Tax=Thermosyntropha sp. TaxID=2740820 RepID=UPI0025E42387|nr:tetratricopeptide repeat protein [Thermosyntropha sp.]MBO8158804.1 tetratricopeptide repeat protein [Thermosyntropha sp.]